MKQTLIIFMFFGFLFAEDNIAKYKVKGMECSQSCPVKITEAIKRITCKYDKILFQSAYIAIRKDGLIGAASIQKNFYYIISTPKATKICKVKGVLE